jgi:16S rRNA (guanine966-N2)-methyltransferase
MRIIAGTFRGRAVAAPAGRSTRPTADRTRQAMFNVLDHGPWAIGLKDARILDLFAGSGALGLEALSRGASFCLFIEADAQAEAAIAGNLDRFDLPGRAQIERRDATTLLARPVSQSPFDIAFLDPPYFMNLAPQTLAGLIAGRWLAGPAIVVVEQGAGEAPVSVHGFEAVARRTWGAAQVSYLRPNSRSMSLSFSST